MQKNTSNRFEYAKYIIAHRKKIIELSKKAGCPFYWHDFHKLINVLIFGKTLAVKWHKKYSKHHIHNGMIGNCLSKDHKSINLQENILEAILDWESARYTKSDKPLSAEDWYFTDVKNKVLPEVQLQIERQIKVLQRLNVISRNKPLTEVEKFIQKFGNHQSGKAVTMEVQFTTGYCWHFAKMLQATFKRGEVVWCAPQKHMAFRDIDGQTYDIRGVINPTLGGIKAFIPEEECPWVEGYTHQNHNTDTYWSLENKLVTDELIEKYAISKNEGEVLC